MSDQTFPYTRYQHVLAHSPPSNRQSPGASVMASRMSNRSGASKFSKSPKARAEDSRMTYKDDPTGMQTIKQWQKVPEASIDLVAQKKI